MAPSAVVQTKSVPVTRRFTDEPWELVDAKRAGQQPVVVFELATSFTGEIVHVDGPFKATAEDAVIFCSGLKHRLLDGEQVLVGEGFGHVPIDGVMLDPGASAMRGTRKRTAEVRAGTRVVERAIGRLDALNIMHCGWRLDKEFLKICVFAAVKLSNAMITYCPLK